MGKPVNAPSAHDVAKLAGVSQSVVSRAFTPGAKVSAKTREHVLQVARKIGYRPNLVARSLIKGRSGLVGLVVGNPRNPSCTAALEALSAMLTKIGKHILIFAAENADAPADVHIEDLMQYKVDALVLISASMSAQLAKQCQAMGIPVISSLRVGQSYEGMASVTGDNHHGARQIAEHLFTQDYRKLAYLASFRSSPTSCEREVAFCEEAIRLGLPVPEVISGHFRREKAMEAARQVLSRPDPPDAIYCANDYLAFAVMDVARFELGIEIGRQLGVAGFDNIEEARWPCFDLTTYSQPVEKLMTRVVELIANEDVESPPPYIVEQGELICRGSTRRT